MAGGPDTSIIVCNFGTHSVRVGFAGDAVPFYDEPSVVWATAAAPGGSAITPGRKRPRPTSARSVFFAADAAPAGCEITSPVKAGLVADWDAAWAHIERALSRADGAETSTSAAHSAPATSSSSSSSSVSSGGLDQAGRRSGLRGRRLLVVDNLLAPRAAREAWAEEALAWRGAIGISFVREPVAICFAHGFISGLVIDIGATACRVTPVESGYPLVMAHRQSTAAGDFMDLATHIITRPSTEEPSASAVDPGSLLASDAEVTHSPWMGGSIMASAGTLPDLFIGAKEWDSEDTSKLLARCI